MPRLYARGVARLRGGGCAGSKPGVDRVALAAQYTQAEGIYTHLRSGSVAAVSARWLLARAGYEEEEVEVEWEDILGEQQRATVRKWLKRREPRPLPCRQQLEAGEPNAFLSVQTLERIYRALKRRDKYGDDIPFDALPIVSGSHCWETSEHPDPHGRTLAAIAAALAGKWSGNQPRSGLPLFEAWGFEDMGIFFGARSGEKLLQYTCANRWRMAGLRRPATCTSEANGTRNGVCACVTVRAVSWVTSS